LPANTSCSPEPYGEADALPQSDAGAEAVAQAEAVAAALGGDLVPMGSAGAKAMAVVRGEAEIYLHSGGQFEWDSCAPVAVALAHGLHCSRIDGSPLVYNQADTYMPDLLICRPEWAAQVLAEVARLAA
jgi:3'(2'), 5'-bisphosphate nucleotidase